MAVHITAYLDGSSSDMGYRFIVTDGPTGWRAYRTVAGLKYFLSNFGLKIDKNATQLHDLRKLGKGRYITMFCEPKKVIDDFCGFWEISEVPKEAKAYVDLVNGSYVQCYILDKGDEVITYKPNPNAKNVYVPFDYAGYRSLIG